MKKGFGIREAEKSGSRECKFSNSQFLNFSGSSSGFTLVELSLVLIIIAVIVGMTLGSGIVLIGSAKLTATQKKMAAIDQALLSYRTVYDQLPCPSDLTQVKGSQYYGTAQTSSGYCVQTGSSIYGVRTSNNANGTAVAIAEGGVPVMDLGLPADFMYDGWGNRIRYAVDVTMANTGNTSGVRNTSNGFSGTGIGASCGQISIKGNAVVPGTNNYYTRSANALYALMSSGPNGHGAFNTGGTLVNASSSNADELQNCNCTSAGAQNNASVPSYYVQAPPYSFNISNALYNFDDIVTYKERWQMVTASDKPGNACPLVYASNVNGHNISMYDMSGNALGAFGTYGTPAGQFSAPAEVFVDNFGYFWNTDRRLNRVQKFGLTPNGTGFNFVAMAGCGINGLPSASCTGATVSNYQYGTIMGAFTSPTGPAIDHNGNVWVVDSNSARVQKFDANLNFILAIGCGFNGVGYSSGCTTTGNAAGSTYSTGWVNGAFSNPRSISVDPANNIWVADTGNYRVQEFDSNGNWLQTIGYDSTKGTGCETSPNSAVPACSSGAVNGQFSNPYGTTVDQNGNVWVSDYGNSRIQEFTNNGVFITSITSSSPSLSLPYNAMTDNAGNVWIAALGSSAVFKCYNASGTWTCKNFTANISSISGVAVPSFAITNATR